MFSRTELEAAWGSVLDHDRHAELPDVIGWRDLHAATMRGEVVPPLPVSGYFVPKGSSASVRRIDVLDPAEHARYVAALAPLVTGIERRLDPGVTAHRALPRPLGLWLEPWRRARSRHRFLVRRLLAGGPGAVLVADVRDCFGQIRPETVATSLGRMGARPLEIAALQALLRRGAAGGVGGLPVGPDPSAILANAVLAGADRAITVEGGRHVRWVDDFAIAVRDRAAAARVLDRLRAALKDLGLGLAPEKCRIVDGDDVAGVLDRFPGEPSGGGRGDQRVLRVEPEATFGELEAGSRSLSDLALVLRIRAVAASRWGRAEAEVLLGVAEEVARSTPVRAWAWRALALTDPGRCLGRAAELADEPDPWLQRAVVAAVGLVGGVRARRVLRALRDRIPQVAPTAAWGQER
jgi:reverse transcriptase-like protein